MKIKKQLSAKYKPKSLRPKKCFSEKEIYEVKVSRLAKKTRVNENIESNCNEN